MQTSLTDRLRVQQVDLFLQANNSPSSLSICHRKPQINKGYAATIGGIFLTILENMNDKPGSFVRQLDVIHAEQKLQIQSWTVPDPFSVQVNMCMHDLVSAQCHRTPTSEAVCSWDGALTYHELHHLSTIAADRLRSMGVGPGSYVPFAYEKSMWAVVATLAILMVGAAFVPLNPHDPRARLDQILDSVKARAVVTSEGFAGLFGEQVETIVISEQTVKSRDSKCSNGLYEDSLEPKTRKSAPKEAIFVLFTSGSTGIAKGMIHTHSSICTHALSHGKAMGYHRARVLQFAAYTFDVAFIDIFTTLLFGGCICIPSEEDRKNDVVGAIRSMRADHAILTPSFAGIIEPSDVPTLKILAVGGEALPRERVKRWAEKVRLIQIYGPAEAGICLAMDMQVTTRPEMVGRPLDNSSCWLVDPDDSERLVPIGAVGELVVAGPSLAQGYLNDVTRTAAAFIAAPVWARRFGLDRARFYKTGDLLRYNVDALDGTFDFVGRKDAQIKLRGQRIEPGEIEYHLGKMPGVAVCMVTRPVSGCFAGEMIAVVQLLDENVRSTRVRAASLHLMPGQPLHIAAVRDSLEKVLPGYMIPSACLAVESMPLMPSLKIDRRTVDEWLRKLVTRPIESTPSILAPLNIGEETAIALSKKVAEFVANKDKAQYMTLQGHDFRLQEIGIDSIQIISLSMLLQREYATKVPMELLLSSELTIRGLASLVDGLSPSPVHGHVLRAPQDPTHIDIHQEAAQISEDLLQNISSQRRSTISQPRNPIRNVLVTGATGYLGTAILHQLFTVPTLHVYALIRGADHYSGLQRIREAGMLHNWWQESYTSRLHIWEGDLALPNLGLGPQEVRNLLGQGVTTEGAIHAMIHNGARVHYSTDYYGLKPTNVCGTASALHFVARASHLQKFVFVSGGTTPSFDISNLAASSQLSPPTSLQPLSPSSCSASPSSSSQSSSVPARSQVNHAHDPAPTGYTTSKLVSELLVMQCTRSPLFTPHPLIRIVRPGYLIGAPPNGLANRTDFLWRLVAGCIGILAYNRDDAERWLAVADVETVARVTVASVVEQGGCLAGQEQQTVECAGGQASGEESREDVEKHGIARVTDGLPLHRLWSLLTSEYGYRLEPLPQPEFLSRLRSHILGVGEQHLLYPLLHILERNGGCIGEDIVADGSPASMDDKSRRVEEAVRSNVDFLIRVGFLPRGN